MRFTTFASWLGRSIAWHLGGAIVHHAPAVAVLVLAVVAIAWAARKIRRLRRSMRRGGAR